ncbi:MAG TPA: hypothetical protein IAC14_14680, partial [Candidatus Scybalomonas excrementigallinarum]|nr:hypothetical protein [Candidatus Scybalomonas excrementigallinarum]
TISFSDNYFVCVIKKNINYQNYNKNIICDLLHGAAKKYVDLAHREALQYVLEEINGEIIPVVSLIFWGDKDKIWANLSQDEIFDLADNMLKPILYDEDKAIDYWKNYYEMSLEQIELLKKIYFKRLNNTGKIFLNNEIKKILMDWFEDIDECIESFQEINIFFIEE